MARSTSQGTRINDWDPMQEDFNNSNYDSQYPEDSSSEGVKLDHCRLYVTNITKALSEAGLRTVFTKYGKLVESFISKDPLKRYAMVKFETAAEARHAMMKLNKTEPLRLNISIAHEKSNTKPKGVRSTQSTSLREQDSRDTVPTNRNAMEDRSNKKENFVVRNRSDTVNSRKTEDMANGDNFISVEDLPVEFDNNLNMDSLDPELQMELEKLQMEELKLAQAQVACKKRMLLKQVEKRAYSSNTASSQAGVSMPSQMSNPVSNHASNTMSNTVSNRCVMPDGKVVLRNAPDSDPQRDVDIYATGAGDSSGRECSAWEHHKAGTSTPSTCKVGSDCTFDMHLGKDKSDYSKYKKELLKKNLYDKPIKDTSRRKSAASKATDKTSKKSDRFHQKPSTDHNSASKTTVKATLEQVRAKISKHKSDIAGDLKHSYFYEDTEDEADETTRLVQLRNTDYADVVDDQLKVVVALEGYPKLKMRLRQMETFQRCLAQITDIQLKAGLLKRKHCFLDCYLNRGAIVCICKDPDTKEWIIRIQPGLQESMCVNLIFLKCKIRRLCLATLKIPHSCWPATAIDTFKMLQYFNPTLKIDRWKIYSQKVDQNGETTFFMIDRVSGEIIRGQTFKNVIDYNEMEFELSGYTEIYYDYVLSEFDEDLSSVASRVKLLEKIKSVTVTPSSHSIVEAKYGSPKKKDRVTVDNEKHERTKQDEAKLAQSVLEESLGKHVFQDVKYVHEPEGTAWSDESNFCEHERRVKRNTNKNESYVFEDKIKMQSCSAVTNSEKESMFLSNDNLSLNRSLNLNIDSNRGIAYHRRTNYLHVENELKIAITLEGYPEDKLEGTHIRRLKHLYKEYLHKDMKSPRFSNMIIPKFQDIYLSNGAIIYICDSLETKDYLKEILPKYINSTGLKLTLRDMKNLVRYTRVVMRLPKKLAHIESRQIISKLQATYPGLKPNCWKYYSDVAGKQKRQFGVDPESLEVIKNPEFDPVFDNEKINFRVINRQKRDVFDEIAITEAPSDSNESKQLREIVSRNLYLPINPEVANAPLSKMRSNHYTDIIDDDHKLYISPSNYPKSRVDEALFHIIKRAFENIVVNRFEKGELTEDTIPKFHDMYLFDGVIFMICQSMDSRHWIENNLHCIGSTINMSLKATEFRGAVGIISMVFKTEKDTDEVISILQNQNPRLRTKFWRKISTVKTKYKLDVVLQIDKLSAEVMTSENFKDIVDSHPVQFKLGHLRSLIKPKASLDEINKMYMSSALKPARKSKSRVSMQGPKDKTFEELMYELRKEYPSLRVEDWNMLAQHEKANHQVCELEIDEKSAKIIENEDFKLSMGDEKLFFYTGLQLQRAAEETPAQDTETPRSIDTNTLPTTENDLHKFILKIPMNILPDNKDDLNIIFDLLEDKNPGLNTELWKVYTEDPYPSNGKFTLLIDRQSAIIIKGKKFDPKIGGEKLRFYF